MKLSVRKNENISLTVMYDGIEKTCTGEIVTEAQSRPASEEELVKNLKKTGDTCFVVEDAEVQLDDGVFVPVGLFLLMLSPCYFATTVLILYD